MEEMQGYLGVLRQLKDFDENLTREIAARAYQEQEKMKLEVSFIRDTTSLKLNQSHHSVNIITWTCLSHFPPRMA